MTYYNVKRKKKKNNKQFLILLIFASLIYVAFNLGKSKNQGNLNYCSSELNLSQDKTNNAQHEKVNLQKNIETLQIEKSLLQEKYEELVKSEETLELFEDINKKVEAGLDAPRIKRAINDLKTNRKCSSKVEKRFIVKTPLYKGDIHNTNVSFKKGSFDITADGYSFINEEKKPESWFDVAKPISISFNTKNGTEVVKEVLPINKAIIQKDKEYFFEIVQSDSRGFVGISSYYCNYP